MSKTKRFRYNVSYRVAAIIPMKFGNFPDETTKVEVVDFSKLSNQFPYVWLRGITEEEVVKIVADKLKIHPDDFQIASVYITDIEYGNFEQ